MRLRFVVLLLLALLTACGDATPPVPAPNFNAEPSGTLTAVPPEVGIPLPPETSSDEENDDAVGPSSPATGFTAPEPESIVSSGAGSFPAGTVVTIGIALPEDFSGTSPLVGPLDPKSAADIAITSETLALSDGSLEFGVYYITSFTTPGSYTLFAEAGDIRLTTTLTVTE